MSSNDPVETARKKMVERQTSAWKTPPAARADKGEPGAPEATERRADDGEPDPEAARKAAFQRAKNAWRGDQAPEPEPEPAEPRTLMPTSHNHAMQIRTDASDGGTEFRFGG